MCDDLQKNAVELKKLLQEEQLVQTELELQHECLKRSYVELEKSRDYYESLFELAPMGYLTLSADGTINTINCTCAVLLGVWERHKLINRHFSKYVTPKNQTLWNHIFISSKKGGGNKHCQLTLQKFDGTTFEARLDYSYVQAKHKSSELHITITEIH
jgi:nitrogen fixation/metabolism regulation signal transduction histidine kinase